MKVIFLDIDGVLNHENFYESRFNTEIYPNGFGTYPLCEFCPESVDNVNKILKETGAKIVISSSWRFNENIDTILSVVGIHQTIYDKTPYLGTEFGTNLCRRHEIQRYLDNHPEIEDYVIIDDDSDMNDNQLSHFFQTSWKDGLTIEITNKIINYFNGSK